MCSSVVSLPDSMRGRPFVCEFCRRRVDNPPPPLSAAMTLSDFVIGEELSQGETGPLYRAHQTSLGREAALKILSPHRVADKDLVRRFVMRAKRLASVDHPAYAHVYAIGEEGGLYFRSTEYIVGESVASRLEKEGKMAPSDVAACARTLAEALQAAWEQHRLLADGLRPEDVLLTDNGVRLLRAGEPAPAEDDGMVEGEAQVTGLVAPEVMLGQACDVRASLYALGVLLFRMATGSAPFVGSANETVSAEYLYRQAPSPRDLVPDFPEDLARLIQRLLLRDPDERFKDGAEVVAALDVAGERPETAASGRGPDGENWRCPTCKTMNSAKGKYCRECGSYGMEPCPACGQGVHLDTAYCPFCGANMKANRQAARERGEALLKRLRNCLDVLDWKGIRGSLKDYAAMDVSILPDEQVRTFELERKRALESAIDKADEAEDHLDLDMYEGSVELLAEMGGELPATVELVRRLERYQAELADGIYQANTAYQTRCYDRARFILKGLRPWKGAVLGMRRVQLLADSTDRVEQRRAAIERGEALLAEPTACTEGLQVRAELAGFRLSRKLMVITPSTDDTACDQKIASLMVGIERNIANTVQALLKEDYWDSIIDLLERTGDEESHGSIVSRRTLTECVAKEVNERCAVARSHEGKGDLDKARAAWRWVLTVPGMFLSEPVRHEAFEFEQRRVEVVVGTRRAQLGGHLSAVFIVWCLAFALSGVNAVADWYDGLLDFGKMASGFGPLVIHLAAVLGIVLFLRNSRVLNGDDLLPRRHAPLFQIGLACLWIASPMSWIVLELNTMVGQRIFELGNVVTWIGLVGIGLIWLLSDVVRAWHYPTLPAALALSLSWWAATAAERLFLASDHPSDAVLVLSVCGLQFVFFVLVHVLHHLLMRTLIRSGRQRSARNPAPASPAADLG